MTLDELINTLQEAKEHGVDGRSKVIAHNLLSNDKDYVYNAEYTSNNVIINYG